MEHITPVNLSDFGFHRVYLCKGPAEMLNYCSVFKSGKRIKSPKVIKPARKRKLDWSTLKTQFHHNSVICREFSWQNINVILAFISFQCNLGHLANFLFKHNLRGNDSHCLGPVDTYKITANISVILLCGSILSFALNIFSFVSISQLYLAIPKNKGE